MDRLEKLLCQHIGGSGRLPPFQFGQRLFCEERLKQRGNTIISFFG